MECINITNSNIKRLIIELRKLDFIDEIKHFEDKNEGIAIKYRNTKFWRIMKKVLGNFGKRLSETFIIQILRDEKTKEHYIFFDDFMALDKPIQAMMLLQLITNLTGGLLPSATMFTHIRHNENN